MGTYSNLHVPYRDEFTETAVAQERLSSGTMIKSSPSLHASFLPDVTEISLHAPALDLDEIETRVQVQVGAAQIFKNITHLSTVLEFDTLMQPIT